MELNSKKLERTSRIIYYSISIILSIFLILLSNKIIGDLDSATPIPEPENFQNKTVLANLDRVLLSYNSETENLNNKKVTIEKTIATARANYRNEKQSFDNWLQTRKTLGSPDKDLEVINRAKKLDEFYKVEQGWRSQLNNLDGQLERVDKKRQEALNSIQKEHLKAEKLYSKELKRYELKVFLIRLLFVAPILALGIFFFIRYRNHKFWPLYFGFTLFSIYAFFFGLMPYLPSYGGYVRYAVGILLSAGLGYYAIRTIRKFIEKKQAELKISTQERAKNVQIGVAEKALQNHFCPSCGKDFILKKWEFPLTKSSENDVYKLVTNFCRHCGLQLFKSCTTCGNKNFAHLPFCASCGNDMGKNSKPAE
ncbi:OmpH family outer membrane protein [Daejeonella oryzae]|uniref:OmpH family outer membrane protein n=1 Tax=Daejeonella oryzae TaxID=1122943 RepID=UPI00047BCAFD|nr:OmpH family outer membrane protein [Daejeonella oryzae]